MPQHSNNTVSIVSKRTFVSYSRFAILAQMARSGAWGGICAAA